MNPDQAEGSVKSLLQERLGVETNPEVKGVLMTSIAAIETKLAWGERLPLGRGFCIHFRELTQALAPDLDTAVVQINQAMEQLIRECPQQYIWGYGRYKQPRQEP